MKIAILRYNLPIPLRLENGLYTGGTDEWLDFLKALVVAGHKIIIFSDVNREDYKWWLEKGYENTNYDFLGKIKIKQTYYIDRDIRHCIIIHGTTSLLFHNKEQVPYTIKCSDQICHFEGVVYYWQADGALPIALHPEKFKYDFIKGLGYQLNIRRMMKNKIWVFLQRCKDTKFFINCNNGTRFQYKNNVEKGYPIYCEYVPTTYCFWLFDKPFLKPKKDPDNFLTYTGNQRARLLKFRKYYYYANSKGFDVVVAGKWNKRVMEKYNKVKWLGTKKHFEMRPLLHNSRCQILMCDKSYYVYNWVTPRVMEVISAGCIVLPDAENKSFIYEALGKKFGFNSQEKLIKLLEKIKKMNYSELKKAVRKQQKIVRKYDYNLIIKYMEKILKTYDDKFKELKKEKYIAGSKRITRKNILVNKPQLFGRRNKGNQSKKTEELKKQNLREFGFNI